MIGKHCCAMVMLLPFLWAATCVAQLPQPTFRRLSADRDISYQNVVAQTNLLAHWGYGGEFTASQFVTKNAGFQIEADYFRTDFQNLRDTGMRCGPIVRLWTSHPVQLYAHALLGYAMVKSTFLRPVNSLHRSASVLAGGGLDFPISRGWYARAGVDIENDWTAIPTRSGRGIAGISYRFATW